MCFIKWVFLKVLQNSLENTSARVSFFDKVGGLRPAAFSKKTLAEVFPVNFAKLLGIPFLHNTLGDCFCTVGKVNRNHLALMKKMRKIYSILYFEINPGNKSTMWLKTVQNIHTNVK